VEAVMEVVEAAAAARRTCISLTACCMPDVCAANSPTLCSVYAVIFCSRSRSRISNTLALRDCR
jgi:hypothetical protein